MSQHYPIAIGSDTGTVAPGDGKVIDYVRVAIEPHPTLVGAGIGLVLEKVITGKFNITGALIGIVGGHLTKAYLQGKL